MSLFHLGFPRGIEKTWWQNVAKMNSDLKEYR